MKRILLSWSSGKDSAWSLHVLRQQGQYEIVGLLTTFNEAAGRVAMHAVRRELVEQQASAAGLPLWGWPFLGRVRTNSTSCLWPKRVPKRSPPESKGSHLATFFSKTYARTAKNSSRALALSRYFRFGGGPLAT